jgi:uncharacterized protein YjbI with pentapeptide repeats
LRQINFTGANLAGQNFINLDLRGARFERANMEGIHLEGANLARANLNGACLERANLEGVRAQGASMNGIRARGACMDGAFQGAELNGADLRDCAMGSAAFNGASLIRANLCGITHYGTIDFSDAKLMHARLVGDFRGANFGYANMEDAYVEGGDFRNAHFFKTNIVDLHRNYAKFDEGALDNVLATPTQKPARAPTPDPKAAMLAVLDQRTSEPPSPLTQAAKHHRHLLGQLPTPGLNN